MIECSSCHVSFHLLRDDEIDNVCDACKHTNTVTHTCIECKLPITRTQLLSALSHSRLNEDQEQTSLKSISLLCIIGTHAVPYIRTLDKPGMSTKAMNNDAYFESINCMPEYGHKSTEELRYEDQQLDPHLFTHQLSANSTSLQLTNNIKQPSPSSFSDDDYSAINPNEMLQATKTSNSSSCSSSASSDAVDILLVDMNSKTADQSSDAASSSSRSSFSELFKSELSKVDKLLESHQHEHEHDSTHSSSSDSLPVLSVDQSLPYIAALYDASKTDDQNVVAMRACVVAAFKLYAYDGDVQPNADVAVEAAVISVVDSCPLKAQFDKVRTKLSNDLRTQL